MKKARRKGGCIMKIALFGKMRSGKNTVADILKEQYEFKEFAFGDGIGEIITKYFPEAFVNGKPRRHYQHIGQELRKLNPDVWVNYLFRSVNHYLTQEQADSLIMNRKANENIVITDGRQLNEAERLKEAGYIIIKVETPEDIRIQRIKESGDNFSPEQLNHETEKQVDLIEADVVIKNDGTLEQLKALVGCLVKGVDVYV